MDEAITEYQVTTRLIPNRPIEHDNLAEALMAANRVADTIAEYREATRLMPDVPNFHFALIAALMQQVDGAFAVSQEVHRFKLAGPRDPGMFVGLAQALYDKGKRTQARQLQ